MSRRATSVSLLLTVTMLAAGCGSAARQAGTTAVAPQPPSLSTSLVTATGTWAVAVMGGPAAEHNDFWQLFVRPAGTGRWRLATPPGVASNGGLVMASLGAGSVVAGFRPSQDLSFSPLATTHDNGTAWTPGLVDAALADVPDALAAAPGGGRLLALLASGQAELSGPSGTAWTRLATRRALAASAARRPVRAGQPHRGGVQPVRGAHAGRQLCPPRDGRRLRVCEWDVAPGRTHPASLVRAPACHRAPAHHHGWHHHGTAGRGHRGCGRPARRLVHRQRCPLGPVAAAATARRETHLGIVRARRHCGGGADREPRADHHPPSGLVAAAARAATRNRDARTGSRRRVGRPRRPQHQAGRLAAPARQCSVGRHTDHQRSRPVRVIELTLAPFARLHGPGGIEKVNIRSASIRAYTGPESRKSSHCGP